MNPVIVRYVGVAQQRLPALGQGLWVDRLTDLDGAENLILRLRSAHLDLQVDLRNDGVFQRLANALDLCQRADTDAWLLATVDDSQPEAQLHRLAELLAGRNEVRGLLLTPAAYLESYQPDAQWPTGLNPTHAAQLAREYFPRLLTGGGVPTYFTELNRCRPEAGSFDYLTHATSPTVHAADDRSVIESLESLPDVFRSARQLAGGQPYRLTTTAIGAWRNPYGGQLTANLRRERLTLSDQDPRQRGLLAAAWTLAHYQAAHEAGVDAIALWAVNEPFAVAQSEQYWPIFHVLKGLALGREKTVLRFTASSPDIAVLAWSEASTPGLIRLWLGNLTAQPQPFDLPDAVVNRWRVLDQDAFSEALADPDFMDEGRAGEGAEVSVLPAWAVAVIDCRLKAGPAL